MYLFAEGFMCGMWEDASLAIPVLVIWPVVFTLPRLGLNPYSLSVLAACGAVLLWVCVRNSRRKVGAP